MKLIRFGEKGAEKPGVLLGEQRHLRVDELLAHHLGVTALALATLLVVEHQELAAEALDLIGDGLAGVEGADDGAETFGRGDGGRARQAPGPPY